MATIVQWLEIINHPGVMVVVFHLVTDTITKQKIFTSKGLRS